MKYIMAHLAITGDRWRAGGGEVQAEIQVAPLKFTQVVEDDAFDLVFNGGQFLDPLQQTLVGEGGNGGGDRRVERGFIHRSSVSIDKT